MHFGGRGGRGRGMGPRRNHNANVIWWHCGTEGHVERNYPTRNHAFNAFIQRLDASAHSTHRTQLHQFNAMDINKSNEVVLDEAQFDLATRSIDPHPHNDANRDTTSTSYPCMADLLLDAEQKGEEVMGDTTWEKDHSFLARHLLYASSTETGLPLHRGYINGHPVSILIDSGASANYMSPRLQSKANHVVSITKRNVETANGAHTSISKRAHITLDLGGYMETDLPVYLFDSKFDVILGQAWLQKVFPQPHWPTDRWFIHHGGQRYVLEPVKQDSIDQSHHQSHALLSAKELNRLFKDDEVEQCYLLDASEMASIMDGDTTTNTATADSGDTALIKSIIAAYPKVFDTKCLNGLPPDRGIPHAINTGDATPINRPPYRMSPRELDELKRQLNELLDLGLIEPSTSPWGAPLLFVRKKDESMRMCIDYRALNKATIRNTSPLPRIDECLDRLHGAKFFSSLDLKSGYHQIRLDPADAPKTAMNTRYGKFSWRVLPFGLANSPSIFQAQMNATLGNCVDDFAMVYLDDILAFSKTKEKHERHLRHVLDRLQGAQFVVNLKKCHLFQRHVNFLGFKVSAEGTAPDDNKVKAIVSWPTPSNVQEVRSFVGTVQHFRRCIPNFASIATPLTDLTQGTGAKRRPIVWTPACQESFDRLKHLLTVAPVLQAPCMDRPFRIETDASDLVVGPVLCQPDDKGRWHPLAYESRKFSLEERSYPVQERELLAILHALRTWRYLVEGSKCVVLTDHEPLKYLRSKPNPNSRIIRWISDFELYQPDIQYQRGEANVVPDALSRLGGPNSTPSPSSFEPDFLYATPLAHDSD